MKFIRIFWGDLEVFDSKFKTQITNAAQDIQDNEVVMVWGEENNKFLKDLGYTTYLISNNPWKEEFGTGHHMFNHTSLLHKLYAFNIAVDYFDEVLFLDWDCYKIKEYDKTFYSYLESGSPFQVPLYIYPFQAIKDLQNKENYPDFIVNFINKLEVFLKKYSYNSELGYIIPNTGFMYCKDSDISSELLNIALDKKLEAVPDEFAVMVYALQNNLSLDDYINTIEPNVTYGKHQTGEGEEYWQQAQIYMNNLTSSKIKKDIYFNHV